MSGNLELRVTLETVTPLFLGGAKGKNGPPELRPPAFRGAMRYWLRAALGGVIGDENLEGLRRLETAVFGSTDSGSPFSIRLKGEPESEPHFILPHKDYKDSGPRRLSFKPKQKFELVMQMNRSNDGLVWVNACMALNLALTFGGFGLRSRRGYGSLRVVSSSAADLIPLSPTRIEDWPKRVSLIARSAVAQAKKLAKREGVQIVNHLPKAPTTFPCAAKGASVRIIQNFGQSPTKTLSKLMKKMPKAAFLGGIKPRQASPLWVNVFQASNAYHLLLCVLPSKLKAGTDYNKLTEFLDQEFPINISITGWNDD